MKKNFLACFQAILKKFTFVDIYFMFLTKSKDKILPFPHFVRSWSAAHGRPKEKGAHNTQYSLTDILEEQIVGWFVKVPRNSASASVCNTDASSWLTVDVGRKLHIKLLECIRGKLELSE